MPGVRKVASEIIRNLPNLGVKQTLKVAAKFVHNDAVTMSAIFAKAQVTKDGGDVVISAIPWIDRDGIPISPDLDSATRSSPKSAIWRNCPRS